MNLRDILKGLNLKGVFSSSISSDPFEVAVATILSQNTSDVNAIKAFICLKEELGGRVTPHGILSLESEVLESVISLSGLKKSKSRYILNLANKVINFWNGDIRKVLEEEDPRKSLMSIYGIGPKTADVILLHIGYNETFAIDRHIERVVKRFGLVNQKDSYEIIRLKLMEVFPPEDRLIAHKLLILIGRTYCRPSKPNCHACPLKDACKKLT
ncbi:MAG: endonuclease III [Synergistetes bacterium]|nr:endonuclease III [Synergistota bacterium]MCX8127625.1 endonuclease III [Synergistota bacterium]MDW8191458.1 endonuclease III [Synergistota bacterium]